ncbi:MAG: hypothetical protein LBR26_10125 [Prevotella sp.]|jgi:hypothetical protein|nr:hypothetical protein [Prevotella sp.]
MYSEKLEKLIELALADGVLTDKKKQVLLKNAQAEGIDPDEFEMALDAKLHELTKNKVGAPVSTPVTAPQTQSNKFGEMKKCPACGAIAPAFSAICPDCGCEFRNVESSQNVIKFFEKLDDLESTRQIEATKDSTISFGTILKWLFFWYIMLPLNIIRFFSSKLKSAKWTITDTRKEELIINYPVPNTKTDVFEFLTLASSRVVEIPWIKVLSEKSKYDYAWNRIWIKKIQQIQTKSSILLKHDKTALQDIENIVNGSKNIIKKNNQAVFGLLAGFFAIIAVLIIWWSVSNHISNSKDEKIISQIEQAIGSKDFQQANDLLHKLPDKDFLDEDNVAKHKLRLRLAIVEMDTKIEALELKIQEQSYSEAATELKKMKWTPIGDVSYHYDDKNNQTDKIKSLWDDNEQAAYNNYINKKKVVNETLPKKFRLNEQEITQ